MYRTVEALTAERLLLELKTGLVTKIRSRPPADR